MQAPTNDQQHSVQNETLTQPAGGIESALPESACPSRQKSVLVMDDESIIRTMTSYVLEQQGYRVLTAEDGHQTIERYCQAREAGTPVDVVIMDLHIPRGMGGREAAGRLLEIEPEAQVIASSGNSSDPALSNFLEYGFKGALRKPFSIQELKRTVKNVLDSYLDGAC